MSEVLDVLEALSEELYFRAAAAQSREERKAIKGVEHSIERVLEKFGRKVSFERTEPGKLGKSILAKSE